MSTTSRPGFVRGILQQVCPRCRTGRVHAASLYSAPFRMNVQCPVCGLRFEREYGYFTGAMYISYALMILPACAVYFAWLIMGWRLEYLLIGAFVVSLPLVPFVVRMSRVIWIYVDRSLDP